MTPADADAWLELAVEADLEAVEAVEAISEILGRVASGGTTIEPAFDLVEEGLGARIDPSRPVTIRRPTRRTGKCAFQASAQSASWTSRVVSSPIGRSPKAWRCPSAVATSATTDSTPSGSRAGR